MPFKDPEKRKQAHAKYMREVWYPANRVKHIGLVRVTSGRVRRESRAAVQRIKEERGCIDCGVRDHRVLDFDHVSGEKRFAICAAIGNGRSLVDIMVEIEKCEVRCANCHRIATFNRRNTAG